MRDFGVGSDPVGRLLRNKYNTINERKSNNYYEIKVNAALTVPQSRCRTISVGVRK